jgi:hypothetical protein
MKILHLSRTAVVAFVFSSLVGGQLRAETADPVGDWRWSTTIPSGQTRETNLTIRKEGDRLTGFITGRDDRRIPIENVRVKGDEINFEVTRERQGATFKSKYQGKIKGDTIEGEMEFQGANQTRTRPWQAKRQTANLEGQWVYSFTTPGGQTFEPVLRLEQNGSDLKGVVAIRDFETPISKGKVQGNNVSFEVVRERDGNTFKSVYNGKLEGNVLRGTVASNWGGNERTFDFEARRVN